MAQRAVLVGGVLLAGALLGASAPWSRVLPQCAELPAAQRESARLAGRCDGLAPIVNVKSNAPHARQRVRDAQAPRKAVPDLRGRPFNRRDERLARFVVAIDYRESAQRRDWVIDQQPRPPATLPEGGNLRVVLSDGGLVRVPDVRGNFARALATLYRAGLSWSSGDGHAGSVVGQVPAPGTTVKIGTPIVLRLAPGPVALAPESTRPEVAPAPPPTAPPPATTPASPPAGSTAPPASRGPAAPPLPGAAPTTTTMPDVHGMIFDAARERLGGFNVQRVHRAGTEPGGTVIGQSPAAGTALEPGTTVRLVLSDGTLVRVPRVMSFTLSEARQRLASGELRPMIANVASDAPAGTVVSQQPAEGAIAQRGSAIRLNVSSGPATSTAPPAAAAPATVPVPNLVGALFDRARPQLERFKVERSERAAREPVGTILEQSPPAGTQVAPGSPIALIVSSGGRPEVMEVANVVGQDAEAATRTLSEFRLERVEVPSTEPAGRVLEQEPPAGATVPPGSTVRLRVSNAALVRAPSIANMTLGQARDAARAAGLAVALSAGSDDPRARVKGQQPAAGAEVPRGTALQVEVEQSVLPFSLPPAMRDAWTQASSSISSQSARNLAIGVVVLLALLALLLLAMRRRRSTYAPMVEPVFGPTTKPDTERPVRRVTPAPATAPKQEVTPAPAMAPKQQVTPASAMPPRQQVTPAPAIAPKQEVTPASAMAPRQEVTSAPGMAPKQEVTPAPAMAPQPAMTPPPAFAPKHDVTPSPEVGTTAAPVPIPESARRHAAAPPPEPRLEPRRRVTPPRVASPTLAERRAKLAALAPAPVRAPEPEPVVYGARARLEADPEETVAPGAAPRGPEIRIAARLDAGESSFRELPPAPAPHELTEETK